MFAKNKSLKCYSMKKGAILISCLLTIKVKSMSIYSIYLVINTFNKRKIIFSISTLKQWFSKLYPLTNAARFVFIVLVIIYGLFINTVELPLVCNLKQLFI